tara:strand:+ start:37564 stop:37719 length:156 start_codon:yes stop_codon:yes gene_type:complete
MKNHNDMISLIWAESKKTAAFRSHHNASVLGRNIPSKTELILDIKGLSGFI